MNCPVDNTQLSMSDRNGIEIDYCPQCRGVWLDRGELDKIIDRDSQPSAQSQNFQQSSQPDNRAHSYDHDSRDYRRDDNRHKKRKESFLGDLFDF